VCVAGDACSFVGQIFLPSPQLQFILHTLPHHILPPQSDATAPRSTSLICCSYQAFFPRACTLFDSRVELMPSLPGCRFLSYHLPIPLHSIVALTSTHLIISNCGEEYRPTSSTQIPIEPLLGILKDDPSPSDPKTRASQDLSFHSQS
jgi:hypothetical protein